MSFDRLCATLIELVSIPSTSGHEEHIRSYLERQLNKLGIPYHAGEAGNLIGTLAGEGPPLLLNAHMDRVPPGLGHRPLLRDGILYSDGTTNLGADDAAGITIILEVLRRIVERRLPHPPIVILFTVQEEVGLKGASAFDPAPWRVTGGIVFDNAFEAGVVVSRGATYEAFDVEIRGRTGHPGKDLAQTVNAIEIFRQANYPHGSLANDQTRILVGRIAGGSARNAVPASVHLEGEIRSFEPVEVRQRYKEAIREAFQQAAERLGGSVEITYEFHCTSYEVGEDEPLPALYRQVLAQRGVEMQMRPTFIGSDTSALRPRLKAFTISTGVVNEHSTEEYVALAPLEQVVEDTLKVLELATKR
ncbi:MAG TPA: M20/M25/M40 family metallo-hydrolase [Ktedonobacteraceae bacterium]|jgi:tripeptide aminopeptidase|nr:M20/M25/M40 family metallo-hydrolase [Ktedonobacteraceae bacterium]